MPAKKRRLPDAPEEKPVVVYSGPGLVFAHTYSAAHSSRSSRSLLRIQAMRGVAKTAPSRRSLPAQKVAMRTVAKTAISHQRPRSLVAQKMAAPSRRSLVAQKVVEAASKKAARSRTTSPAKPTTDASPTPTSIERLSKGRLSESLSRESRWPGRFSCRRVASTTRWRRR